MIAPVIRALGGGALLLLALPAMASEALDASTLPGHLEQLAEAGGAKLRYLELGEGRADIALELAAELAESPLSDVVHNQFEVMVGALEAVHPEVKVIDLLVAYGPEGELAPPGRPHRPERKARDTAPRILPAPDAPFGRALVGKTVALSPGHGYIYYSSLGDYSTQRSNIKWEGCGDCRGIIEDFGTHGIVIDHLLPLLEGAGAEVVLVRERDHQTGVSIVDDGQGGFSTAGNFSAGSSSGGYRDTYQFTNDPGATAEWLLTAPGGPSWLSLWFVAGSNRLSAAELSVHLDGQAPIQLAWDQTQLGRRWVPALPLDLAAGTRVRVQARVPDAGGGVLIADAARLGAGAHGSGHAWWSMGAQPFVAHVGAPSSVTNRSDVSARPSYAEWMGADAYVSVHSNAVGVERSTAAGSVTYRYSCRVVSDHSNDPDPSVCDDPTGSDRLQSLVHAAMVGRIKRDWDPNWKDRGTKAANFGEVSALVDIPGILIETAFHDNTVTGSGPRVTDNQALHDPRWRRATAWGIYEGLTRFLAGPSAPLLAEPPQAITAEAVGPGQVRLRFRPAAGAIAHRVDYTVDDRVLRPGPIVNGDDVVVSDLPADRVLGLRLRAVNEAGVGPPSPFVPVRAGSRGTSILVVDAYEREDAWVQLQDNPHDVALTHALALLRSGFGLDGATEAGLERLDLSTYPLVVLGLGRESTQDEVLSPGLRQRLRSYVDGGGALMMTGTEIGWALEARGNPESVAFLREVLGARYVADDASDRSVRGIGPLQASFGGAPRPLSGPEQGRVEVRYADVFAPEAGYQLGLAYGSGSEGAAVVGPRTLLVGFGLEHLTDPEDQEALASGWVEGLLGTPPPPRDAGVPVPDSGVAPDLGPAADVGPTLDAGVPDQGLPPMDGGIAMPRPTDRLRAKDDTPPVAGGCGCRVDQPQASGSTAPLFLFGLLAALALRRRHGSTRG